MTRHIDPRDLLRLPTVITAISLLFVIDGARNIDTRTGKVKVALGRCGDLLDGYIARKFELSSDAGAIADVVSDKVGLLAIGIGMWRHSIAPKSVLMAMAAKHAVNTVATFHHGFLNPRKRAIQPSRTGKIAMAADTVSLMSFAVADELDSDSAGYTIARTLGWTAAGVGPVAGLIAADRYIRGNFDEA